MDEFAHDLRRRGGKPDAPKRDARRAPRAQKRSDESSPGFEGLSRQVRSGAPVWI
jgi:hypothetical protein